MRQSVDPEDKSRFLATQIRCEHCSGQDRHSVAQEGWLEGHDGLAMRTEECRTSDETAEKISWGLNDARSGCEQLARLG